MSEGGGGETRACVVTATRRRREGCKRAVPEPQAAQQQTARKHACTRQLTDEGGTADAGATESEGVADSAASGTTARALFSMGDFVSVRPRTDAGHNREGGPATVTVVHGDGTYDVRYTIARASGAKKKAKTHSASCSKLSLAT